jgi:hypothetical protein
MKRFEFPGNYKGFYAEYIRTREGPNRWVVLYKNSATMHFDPKEAWRRLGVAKFTESAQAFKAWCMELHDKYGTEIKEGYEDGSFASETKTVM